MKTLRDIFSNQLHFYINKKDLSILELSEILNVSDVTIYSWLNKKKFPRDDKIEKLAEIFNIPVENLITEPTQQINNNNITNSSNFNINQYNNAINENRTLLEENKRLKEENNKLRNNNLSELEIQLLKIYNTLDFKEQIKLLNDLINN